MRDETHRFAITFHQKKKRHQDLSLELQKIEGIGVATVKKLLDYFGSFEAIYAATLDELTLVIGKKTAINLLNSLN